jgi:hypothetical protein
MLANTDTSNEWINWIEDAISKNLIKYFEHDRFYNFKDIHSGRNEKISRANWKNFQESFALKIFYDLNKITIKEIVHEV